MADSFFGFDPAQPTDDDGGGGIEREADYDALNDETFGSAINGDWEGIHENLVLLDTNGNTNGKNKDETDDGDLGDLDFNLARVGLEDCEEVDDDNEVRVQLDPSVWAAHPLKSNEQHAGLPNSFNHPDAFIRQNFANPFRTHHQLSLSEQMQQQQQELQQQHHQQQQQQHQHQQQQLLQMHMLQQQQQSHQMQLQQPIQMPNVPPKILSVEDIERNIRNQQIQKSEQLKQQTTMPQQQHQQQIEQQQLPFPPGIAPPPGLTQNKNSIFPPHGQPQPQQLANNVIGSGSTQKPGTPRIPPGFSLNMLPQHMNAQQQASQLRQNVGNMMNMPHPMNNFPMHPNFNAMRSNTPRIGQPPTVPPHMQLPPFNQSNPQNLQQSVNQFNKRLVHEIQQNHPMLPFNRMNNGNGQLVETGRLQQQQPFHPMSPHAGNHMLLGQPLHSHFPSNMHQQMQHQQHQLQLQQQQRNHNQYGRGGINGNGHDPDYDDYANLMSNRDKQWLIGIQLSQLNTGTPYIDDFYYTVFKERKARLKGIKENRAHKDNQLNHPLTQPRGHAHLVLISMSNKNGNNQQRNNQRERKNSESSKDKETPRTYTPLQFENSLGKLQCGSVTAPRKIIDMDVVGADSGSPLSTTLEISAQRKSRQILLHIETLYRVALKLEDLENPTAIATALIVRERKEKERLMALEQERLQALNGDDNKDVTIKSDSLRSSLSVSDKEESRDDLLAKLLAGLTAEKVGQMMSVRKGKTLIKRILPLIKDHVFRWDVWCAIFAALPLLVRKDRDDGEGLLFALFPQFQAHIQNAPIDAILRITNTLVACEKLNYIFTNKFSISCVIVLLLKIETVYAISSNAISAKQQANWIEFLSALITALTVHKMGPQLVNVSFENDIVKPLVSHFSRFRDLKSQPLIAILTQNTSSH